MDENTRSYRKKVDRRKSEPKEEGELEIEQEFKEKIEVYGIVQ